jgi:hypothetical protein
MQKKNHIHGSDLEALVPGALFKVFLNPIRGTLFEKHP